MNTTQPWAGLPDNIKRQAARDMLAGKTWMYWGNIVENPGADELRRWVGIVPQSPQEGAEVAGSIRTAGSEFMERYARAREGKPMTRQEKRDAVDRALQGNVGISDRELSRKLGVSHTFIAMRRRKACNEIGNVTRE